MGTGRDGSDTPWSPPPVPPSLIVHRWGPGLHPLASGTPHGDVREPVAANPAGQVKGPHCCMISCTGPLLNKSHDLKLPDAGDGYNEEMGPEASKSSPEVASPGHWAGNQNLGVRDTTP